MNNTYILGLNFLHSDTSAAIFKNGFLLAAAEEERFTRVKHTSEFPINSINFCLKEAQIDISNLDIITINSNPFFSLLKKINYTFKNIKRLRLASRSIKNIKKKISLKKLISKIDLDKKFKGKIKYIDHHEAHIASSLYFSPFNESLNVSVDGFGDFVSSAWGICSNNKLHIDGRIYFPHSMGIFYQAITQFLGFKNYGDEYKVMGLSSFGKPTYERELSKLLFNTAKGFELNLDYFIHQNENIIENILNGQIQYKDLYTQKLSELIGNDRKINEKINQRHMDIAKSAQKIYENTFFNFLNNLYEKYKIKNLTISGGCAMNSVANGKIIKNTNFEYLYVSPNPGDAGGSVGSACVYINKNFKNSIEVKNYAYLGSKYDENYIKDFLNNNPIVKKYKAEYIDDRELFKYVALKLSESKIVGWFQGQTEWGARALGNRSILADARNPNIKDIINSKIKRRESFRPFAPSILYEKTKEWFEIENEIPFMSEVHPIKKEKINMLPGITHVDGTGRLQTVKKENNLKYYNLIKSFYEITDVPIILNTSFNENEPIVNNPIEAVECFDRTEMDLLVIENYLISRS